MRCAPLGPTPGSLPSSSMRLWTIPSYTWASRSAAQVAAAARLAAVRLAGDVPDARDTGEAGHLTRAAERADTRRERPHLFLLQLACGPVGVPDRREDQVGDGLGR